MDFFLKNNKRKCPFIRDLFKSTLNNNDYFKNFAFPPLVSHGLGTFQGLPFPTPRLWALNKTEG